MAMQLIKSEIKWFDIADTFKLSVMCGYTSIAKGIWKCYPFDMNLDYDYLFQCLCESGDLEMTKWLYARNQHRINIHADYEYVFKLLCQKGNLEMAKWLWEISNHQIDIHAGQDYPFQVVCTCGNLEMAKWLWEISGHQIDLHANQEKIFRSAGHNLNIVQWLYLINESPTDDERIFKSWCRNGHINAAKWLYAISKIDVDANTFAESCSSGNLELVQWLYAISKIDVDANAFTKSSSSGNLELVQWLYSIKKYQFDVREAFINVCYKHNLDIAKWLYSIGANQIDIHALDEDLFRCACAYGYLDMAQWLWAISEGTIKIDALNDYAFETACRHCFYDIAKWLTTLSDKYQIYLQDDRYIWFVRNENVTSQNFLENNEYDKAVSSLKISSCQTNEKQLCIICHEDHFRIIQFPCKHTCCLDTLLNFIIINNISTKKCFYCQREYSWNECISFDVENIPEDPTI